MESSKRVNKLPKTNHRQQNLPRYAYGLYNEKSSMTSFNFLSEATL